MGLWRADELYILVITTPGMLVSSLWLRRFIDLKSDAATPAKRSDAGDDDAVGTRRGKLGEAGGKYQNYRKSFIVYWQIGLKIVELRRFLSDSSETVYCVAVARVPCTTCAIPKLKIKKRKFFSQFVYLSAFYASSGSTAREEVVKSYLPCTLV